MFQLTIPPKFKINPEQFERLVECNADKRLELTKEGELIIMPPTGGTSGWKNSSITAQLYNWTIENGTGISFDSSTEFTLPDGSRRSPDAAWIRLERWNCLTQKQQDGFPPIAPDFVIELVSPSDLINQRYEDLQEKMRLYLDNGVKLGWLIEPKTKKVEIYREKQLVEIRDNPSLLPGETILPGFVLNLKLIFN
ncbi:MAG: Uma2 family endonuclease [Xenococcaceae cyanobacterium MO_188.B32]|nr:Uma2 family endonuclease [Xenococcaceae cyanobacterium MO_188.B32]